MSTEDQTTEPTQAEIDAGLEEADILRRIERRLLHVDRIAEESLVQVRIGNSQTLSLIVMVSLMAGMMYLLSKQMKGVSLDLS